MSHINKIILTAMPFVIIMSQGIKYQVNNKSLCHMRTNYTFLVFIIRSEKNNATGRSTRNQKDKRKNYYR